MIAAIENVTIPVEHESTDSALSNEAKEALSIPRVLFFAGDEISAHDKYEMPTIKGFGGMYFPQLQTLVKDPASKGMLYRCKFTRLVPRMIGDNKTMLGPVEAAKWDAGFRQSNAVYENGQWKDRVINGFMQSDQQASKEGRLELKRSDHIVYKERYPGEDIKFATKRAAPYGAGGVVEITALKGATAAEVREAQFFFFENWDEIVKGQATLPGTIRELEALIRSKAIPTDWSATKRGQYNQIKGEMLRSCTEYRQTMTDTLNKVEIAMKDSAQKGHSTSYPPTCENALELLEMRRKDEIAAGDSSDVNRLARAFESQNTPSDRALLLQERQAYVAELTAGLRERDEEEEIRLGIKKPTVINHIAADSAPDMTFELDNADVSTYEVNGVISPMPKADEATEEFIRAVQAQDTTATVFTCGAEKANGEQCVRGVENLGDKCFQHQIKG